MRPRRILALIVLWAFPWIVDSSCASEFEPCVTPRDCCDELYCVLGDWEFTTESACLSSRSQAIEKLNLPLDEKVRVIHTFYKYNGINKSDVEIQEIVWKNQHEYAKLVSRLERKYGERIPIPSQDQEREL